MNIADLRRSPSAARRPCLIRRTAAATATAWLLLSMPLHADTLSLKPGMYETRVTSDTSGKTRVDRSCVTEQEAKDVVDFVRGQGDAGAPCKLTQADIKGRHLSGQSVCRAEDPKSSEIRAASEIDFTPNSFSGTVHNTGASVQGKPLDELLKVSAKRVGDCS